MGPNTGAAYVYVRETPGELSSNWILHQNLTASDVSADNNAMFGSSVAIDGDMIVIGAYADDTDKGSGSGSVYMFKLTTPGDPTSTWTQHTKLTASDGAASDGLGFQGLAIDGETIVVGAHGVDGIDSGSGAAYVFSSLPLATHPLRPPTAPSAIAPLSLFTVVRVSPRAMRDTSRLDRPCATTAC